MSFRRLSESFPTFYATQVPTLDRTRVPGNRPVGSSNSPVQPSRTKQGNPGQSAGAIDHWSIVLLYSMGFGAMAVAALMFTMLIGVWMYGQFIWTFTHWDLANVRLAPFKSLAYGIVAATFVAGTGVGLWCFSGAAWKNRKPVRGK